MKYKILYSYIFIGFLSLPLQAGARDVGAMIEVECQNDKILVFPELVSTPQGSMVKFISTYGESLPIATVTDNVADYEYEPAVNLSYSEKDGKYFANFHIRGNHLNSIAIDGCNVPWGNEI